MAAAWWWGAVAAASLLLGAGLGMARPWSARPVGLVLAFGAGALISAVAFELAEEGIKVGGGTAVAVGLGAGALTYFGLDRLVERADPPRAKGVVEPSSAGPALALGALLDGIPEQMVLGIGLTTGEGVSVGLLVAVFVSNLPEAIGSTSSMRAAGRSSGFIWSLWIGVAVVCVLATVAGYALGDLTGGVFKAGINGFAAGALLVMLVDSMIPEATRQAGRTAGLATVLGFAVASGLSTLSS